mmetsp:Transcript_9459/g.13074  ORF Transcript_9459/g.13074 Transcript_9459/m.13074 type:complete len:418 (+) Transcript_9459:142-1395(+)
MIKIYRNKNFVAFFSFVIIALFNLLRFEQINMLSNVFSNNNNPDNSNNTTRLRRNEILKLNGSIPRSIIINSNSSMTTTGSVEINLNPTLVKISSTVYITGTAKGVSNCFEMIRKSVYMMTDLFQSYRIIIYYHPIDGPAFQHWQTIDPNVILIVEDPTLFERSPYKTEVLTVARNKLLSSVLEDMKLKNVQSNNSYMILMDLDDRNFGPRMRPMNMPLFANVMKDSDKWDSISFNREMYYDIWALRYSRFDANVWAFGLDSFALVKIIRRDISRILDESKKIGEPYVPVLSAFNGLAIYKLHKTLDCEYAARCIEFRSPCRGGDCEHVAFHRCMREKHQAKIVIHADYLFTEIPKPKPSLLEQVQKRLIGYLSRVRFGSGLMLGLEPESFPYYLSYAVLLILAAYLCRRYRPCCRR